MNERGRSPALEYVIDPQRHSVRVNVLAVSTPDEVLAFYEGLLHDPDFHPGLGLLVDRRFVSAPPTKESVCAFLEHMIKFGTAMGRPRVAVVVSTGGSSAPWDWVVALTRHYAGSELRVFDRIESADGWLSDAPGMA